jgi:hypothetical protein
MVSVLQAGVPCNPEEQKAFYDKQEDDARGAFNACNSYFQENRILFPENICTEMDQFLSIARKAYRDFGKRDSRPERWDEADEAMRGPAVNLKQNLEARFRQLLGIMPEQTRAAQNAEMATQGGNG